MKFVYAFIAGVAVGSVVWAYFHVKIRAELKRLEGVAVNATATIKKKL